MTSCAANTAYQQTRANQEHGIPGFQVLTVLTPYRLGEDIDQRLTSAIECAARIRPSGRSQFFLFARFSDLLEVGDHVLRQPTWIAPGEPEFQSLFFS